MAATITVEKQLTEVYNQIGDQFRQFLNKLTITSHKSDYPLACIMLIRAVFYQDNCLKIDWPLIQKHWNLQNDQPVISDSDFSDLQCQALIMRTNGEKYGLMLHRSQQKRLRPKQLAVILPIVLPLLVIGVYPYVREFKIGDGVDSYNWSMLLEYGSKARLGCLTTFSKFCDLASVGLPIKAEEA